MFEPTKQTQINMLFKEVNTLRKDSDRAYTAAARSREEYRDLRKELRGLLEYLNLEEVPTHVINSTYKKVSRLRFWKGEIR